eukprot:sb/3475935/
MSGDDEDSWIYDSVVGFLNSPVWMVPIESFVDQHCLGESEVMKLHMPPLPRPWRELTTNQNSLFRSRDWMSANQNSIQSGTSITWRCSKSSWATSTGLPPASLPSTCLQQGLWLGARQRDR